MVNHLRKINIGKTITGIVLVIVVLVIAQVIALLMGNIVVMSGGALWIGNLLAGILYPIIVFLGVKLLCKKILHLSLVDCKATRFSLKPLWCVVAVVMPVLVLFFITIFSGHWEQSVMNEAEVRATITSAIVYFGIGTGIVEELVFRGVIMSLLEYRWNKLVAILCPSVLFGVLHIVGNDLDLISTIQLIIAGSIVGILFSLVTYESGSIWNSAFMHAIWNMMIGGGIVHIGNAADETSMYNYILDTHSFLITGGDFGIEASIVSIVVYVLFAVVAFFSLRTGKDYGY